MRVMKSLESRGILEFHSLIVQSLFIVNFYLIIFYLFFREKNGKSVPEIPPENGQI